MSSIKGWRRRISSRLFKRRRKGRERGGQGTNNGVTVTFPITDLSDDIIVHILSYAGSAPFEGLPGDELLYIDYISSTQAKNRRPETFSPFQPAAHYYNAAMSRNVEESNLTQNAFGTLTHVLPLVCWKFYHLCHQSDGLWKEAMLRLAKATPSVWGHGISEVAAACGSSEEPDNPPTLDMLCDQVAAACGGAKLAFQRIVTLYQPFTITAPLFLMGGFEPPTIMQSMHLHLFEPRYRLMITGIMSNRPVRDTSGNLIPSPRPRFLMSSGLSAPLVVGDPVFVVEILRCRIKNDGRALVTIQCVRQTRIQSMNVRRNSFSLIDATVHTCKRKFDNLRLPIFCVMAMGRTPALYASLELFVFEERYRRMIRDVVSNRDESPTAHRPIFILAYAGTVENGDAAMIVEIRKHILHADGTANIEIVPLLKGRLRDSVERNSGRIYDATVDTIS